MNTADKNDCLECMKYFIIREGWNSQFCSKKCRDKYFDRMEKNIKRKTKKPAP